MTDPTDQIALDIAETLQRMEQGIIERDRQLAKLGAAAPLRSKGRPIDDAAHLPLFVAANERPLL